MNSTIINFDDIPIKVIEDIKQHYQSVSFENYSKPIPEDCLSKASNYKRLIEHNAKGTVLDTVTFEPTEYTGDRMESYIVRGVFTDTSADVYAIVPFIAVY